MADRGSVSHVLIFPFPGQGHINCMFNLAELLSLDGDLCVTFLNSEQNDLRLRRCTDLHTRRSSRKNLRFHAITDGLPDDHPRSADDILEIHASLRKTTKNVFRQMLIAAQEEGGDNIGERWPPVSCLIVDGIMSFAADVAEELGIPCISFRTISAASFWAYFCIPWLAEGGEIPFGETTDMDRVTRCIPGMEGVVRLRDLPSFFRANDLNDDWLRLVLTETHKSMKATGIILNTFYDLEAAVLDRMSASFPKIYTIGPLNAFLKWRSRDRSATFGSASLWKEDKGCMEWLGKREKRSVVYISFGSYTRITAEEMVEFLHGLVGAGFPFLWAIRPDLVKGEVGSVPAALLEAAQEKGCLVEWVPQEEVLAHPSVGGFLTHSGWNSTLESIFYGVPMLCWPFFADQQINSRFVSHVWRVGLDMKDTCSRVVIERLVKELMGEKGEQLRRNAMGMKECAWKSIEEGGSSYTNFQKLVQDIKTQNLKGCIDKMLNWEEGPP
ncbi:7-deoxyloganetic acid glucosyltransferase [Nymphaea thermarum]|nr:7-deoxyloganetic acid glucosyltransferase [Nymphaea thermarum]